MIFLPYSPPLIWGAFKCAASRHTETLKKNINTSVYCAVSQDCHLLWNKVQCWDDPVLWLYRRTSWFCWDYSDCYFGQLRTLHCKVTCCLVWRASKVFSVGGHWENGTLGTAETWWCLPLGCIQCGRKTLGDTQTPHLLFALGKLHYIEPYICTCIMLSVFWFM